MRASRSDDQVERGLRTSLGAKTVLGNRGNNSIIGGNMLPTITSMQPFFPFLPTHPRRICWSPLSPPPTRSFFHITLRLLPNRPKPLRSNTAVLVTRLLCSVPRVARGRLGRRSPQATAAGNRLVRRWAPCRSQTLAGIRTTVVRPHHSHNAVPLQDWVPPGGNGSGARGSAKGELLRPE